MIPQIYGNIEEWLQQNVSLKDGFSYPLLNCPTVGFHVKVTMKYIELSPL